MNEVGAVAGICLACGVWCGCSASNGANAPPAGAPEGGGGACTQSAPAWGASLMRIDGGDAQKNQFAHLGFDAAGNAVAVWERADIGSGQVTLWSATRNAQGTWSAPIQIDGTSGMSAPPDSQIAVAAGGTAIAVWQGGSTGGSYTLPYAAVYDGSKWGPPTLLHADVAPTTASTNIVPRVAILASGDAIVAFAFDDGAPDSSHPDYDQQIYVVRYTGGAWGAPARLSTYDGTYQGSGQPAVAMAASGDAVVVWDQTYVQNQPGDGDRVLVARVPAGSVAATGPAFVDTKGSDVAKTPAVAVDGSGNATVAWIDHQGTTGAWASRLPAGSLQGTPTPLDVGAPGPNAADVVLAVDVNAAVTAVWRDSANDPRAIWTNRFTGGAWTGAVALETNDSGATNPALALDDAGDAMAVWESGAGIKAAYLSVGGTSWGSPSVLDPAASTSGNADVAFAHGCPRALALWTEGSGQSGGNGSEIDSASYE